MKLTQLKTHKPYGFKEFFIPSGFFKRCFTIEGRLINIQSERTEQSGAE